MVAAPGAGPCPIMICGYAGSSAVAKTPVMSPAGTVEVGFDHVEEEGSGHGRIEGVAAARSSTSL